jgi:hypothetical protein
MNSDFKIVGNLYGERMEIDPHLKPYSKVNSRDQGVAQ